MNQSRRFDTHEHAAPLRGGGPCAAQVVGDRDPDVGRQRGSRVSRSFFAAHGDLAVAPIDVVNPRRSHARDRYPHFYGTRGNLEDPPNPVQSWVNVDCRFLQQLIACPFTANFGADFRPNN